jgi:hypothetical protein
MTEEGCRSIMKCAQRCGGTPNDTNNCHCEGAERPKQSFNGYTQGHWKIDCFTAQKNTGPFAMTEVSFHNEVSARCGSTPNDTNNCHCEGAERPKQSFNGYTQGHWKKDCFTAQKSAGPFAMTEYGCHSIMKCAQRCRLNRNDRWIASAAKRSPNKTTKTQKRTTACQSYRRFTAGPMR